MRVGKRSRKRPRRNRNEQTKGRKLTAESLEQKMMLTASLDVQRIGNDLFVEGISDDGEDHFILSSSGQGGLGNVQVSIEVEERTSNGFVGTTFTLLQTFNVPTLEASAATIGGDFLGFFMEGRGGDDLMDGSDLRNLEDTDYDGGAGKDTLIGGAKTRDSYRGGAGDDQVLNADYLDTKEFCSRCVIDGGSADKDDATEGNRLEFTGPNPVTYTNTTFDVIVGTDVTSVPDPGKPEERTAGDKIDSSGFVPHKVNDKGENINRGVKIDLRDGDDTATGSPGKDTIDGGTGRDSLFGEGHDDTLQGGDDKDTIEGGGGKDRLDGDAGDDTIRGGDANDTIEGDDGNDILFGDGGKDTIRGGQGDDRLDGGAGDDLLDGQAGSDWADYRSAPGSIEVQLQNDKTKDKKDGYGNTDRLPNIENVDGSAFNDKITGDGAANHLKGNDGKDEILGGSGDDKIEGGNGDDTLKGQGDRDTILGDGGNDTVEGGADDDTIEGGDGDDDLNGDEVSESVTGNDSIDGGAGSDFIRGWNGNDALFGGDGKDDVRGGFGDDMLSGGDGSDTLDGGRGRDSMEGGFNELITDTIFFEYGDGNGGSSPNDVMDVMLAGGLAWRDEFVALNDFDDIGREPDPDPDDKKDHVNTGDGLPDSSGFDKDKKNEFTLQQRFDIRDEMLNGGVNLIFSDYDGGDGSNGDVLSFGDTQLP